MLKAKRLTALVLALCTLFSLASTVLAASSLEQSKQLKAAIEAVRKSRDSSHIYTSVEGFVGYNDMEAVEFLSLVKKYVIPEGNETVPTLETEADYRIKNATAEKEGYVDCNVTFVCGDHTQKEGIRIKIPVLTGEAAVKSEDREKIEADKSAIIYYMRTVTVTNDTTAERLLEGIQSAVTNGSTVSWGDDFKKKEAAQQWAGSIKGTVILTLNSERETVSISKNIANIHPTKPQEEIIPILEKNKSFESAGFTDVPENEYYANPVNWAVSKNITAGTSATTFSPNEPCTRAQILTFLWRASGSPKATAKNNFTDVSESDYFYDAAIWASEKGMVTGTQFSGDTPCTRSATVMYLWQNAGSPSVELEQLFTDVLINKNYATAVCWAVNRKITSGTSETTFSPDAICTRGQIVTFLFRALA